EGFGPQTSPYVPWPDCSPGQPGVTAELSRTQVPARHRPQVARALAQLADDGGLEAGVHEAVLAARILALLPVVPVDAPPDLLPGSVCLARCEVARALPGLRRPGGRATRRAGVVALAGGELQEERRGGDRKALGELEHALELAVGLVAMEEAVLRDGRV